MNMCQKEISAINIVMQQLIAQKNNAAASLKAATIGRNANAISFWQKQAQQTQNYINALNVRLAAAKAKCMAGKKSSYSNYDPTPDDMAGIYDQCGQLYPNDQGQYDSCVSGAVDALSQNGPSSSTAPSNSGVSGIWDWLKKQAGTFGSGGNTSTTNNPPPKDNLILGMTPSVAITIGLLLTGGIVWGVVALVNKK